MSFVERFKSILIGVGIIAVGIIGLTLMIALRPEPPKEDRVELAPIVQTISVDEQSGMIHVTGSGSVGPQREAPISAQVQGKVIRTSDHFVPGGSFRKGEVLLELDPSDYENAVAMAEAEVTQRRFEVIMAREESQIARDEWGRLKSRNPEIEAPKAGDLGSLVFREPQLKLAESALAAAEARLRDARTRLDRTRLTAPFSGQIRTKAAEIGQVLAPGQVIASLYSTDMAEIMVPLRAEEAALIDNLQSRPRARVKVGGATREGFLARIEGALDPATRSYRVVIQVPNPYLGDSPLLMGSYADVMIDAQQVDTFIEIPRLAVREGSMVWVVRDDRLHFRPIQILTQRGESAIVTAGLSSGDQLVVSTPAVVTDGMSVRTVAAR